MPATQQRRAAAAAATIAFATVLGMLRVASSDGLRQRCNPSLAWRPLLPDEPGQAVLEAVAAEAFRVVPDAATAPCNASDAEASVDGCSQNLIGTLFSLDVNLTCPGDSNWSLSLAVEVHTSSSQQPSGITQVLSLAPLTPVGPEPLPEPGNRSGSDYTGPRGTCSMAIMDAVMGYTDVSSDEPAGFSSAFVEDKDCCFDPAFMRGIQDLITSLVETVLALAKGFNKSAGCTSTETWTTGLAFAHCMLTPADQAAMRQAVATHDSSLCPGFYRDALLQAPMNCRGAVAAMAELSFPYFQVILDACQVPY